MFQALIFKCVYVFFKAVNKEIEIKTVNFRKKLQESFKVPNPLIKSLSPEANLKKNKKLNKQ